MKQSRLTSAFLQSKVARRIFFLFVGCALLPLAALTLISFIHVTKQIKSQSLERLQQASKAHGLSIYERLLSMEGDLQFLASTLESDNSRDLSAMQQGSYLKARLNQRFHGLYVVNDDEVSQTLLGSTPLAVDTKAIFASKSQKSHIFLPHKPPGQADVYLAVYMSREQPHKSMLVAQINTTYLWGIGHENILPSMTELCILNQGRDMLISSFPASSSLLQEIVFRSGGEGARQFEYQDQGQEFLVSFWPLYLKGHYNAPNLTIILRQTKADVLAPLEDFKTIFPLVVLLSLWIVLLLSMIFIRRYMVPVEKLKEATQHIARRDFSLEVKVHSGDEFEDLAHSFNAMSHRLRKQFTTLETISDISQTILASLDRKQIIETALIRLCQFLACSTSEIILFKDQKSSMATSYTYTGENPITRTEDVLEIGRTVRAELQEKDSILLSADDEIPGYLQSFTNKELLILVLPLRHNSKLTGIINLGFQGNDSLQEDDFHHARQLADQVTIALENAGLIERLERLNWDSLEALARTVDAKSPWTAGHSERVTELAIKIAQIMGCGPDEILTLHQAALIHDIGKLGIPQAILDKPASLSEEEYGHLKEHPAIGARILEPLTAFADAINIVLQHHERCDGSGYPHGLREDDICLGARILAVADVYDALVSERPYRDGWVKDKVLEHITQESGRKFDSEVVKAFLFAIQ